MRYEEMRPRLNTAARPLWRDGSTLQFGLDPERAVVVEGVDHATARLLCHLDGTRVESEVLADAAAHGLDVGMVTQLLAGLRRHRLVVDGLPVALSDLGGPSAARRLAPDHAALALRHPGDLAAHILRRRRAAAVAVHGAGRVGAHLATLLAAAGVGRVWVLDAGRVEPGDCAPGGLPPRAADGQDGQRGAAAAEVLRRYAPEVDTTPLPPDRLPDLVVLAETPAPRSDLLASLHAAGVAHLLVGVRENTAVVGPLVRPGASACLRCTDLHRCDRDAAWPVLAAQLATPRRGVTEPCDVVLASLTAALGALQALAQVDGGTPSTVGGSLELTLPDWRVRRRTWAPHARCGCTTAKALRAS
jgi:ThiF family